MKPIKLIALFFCCASCIRGNRICNQSGPRNCTFERRRIVYSWPFESELCGWINDSFSATRVPPLFLALSIEAEQGQLTSELACSTEGETHCLQFDFKFDVNDTIDLTVSAEPQPQPQPQSQSTPEPDTSSRTDSPPALWTLSSGSDTWDEARVPISSRGGFRVVFTAKRRLQGTPPNATVYIDDVLYLRSPCEVQPPQAGEPRPPMSPTLVAPPTLTSIGTAATETTAVPAASRDRSSATTLVAVTTVSAGAFVVAVVGTAVACWVRLKRQGPKHASRPPGGARGGGGGGGGGGAPAAASADGSAGGQDTYENCDAEFPRRGDAGASSSEVQRRWQKSEKSPQPPPLFAVYANNDTEYSYATHSCRDKQEVEAASEAWYELDVEESPRLAEEGSVRATERAAGPGSFAENPSTRKPSTREISEARAEPIYVNFPVNLGAPESRPGQSGGAKSRADSRGSRENTRVQPAASASTSASASASPPAAEIYEPLQNDLGDCHVYNVTESKRQNGFKALPPPTEDDVYYNA